MSVHRKLAHNRGTYLVVDCQKFNISNLVHESRERIPKEVTVVVRRPTWGDNLYPCLANIEQITTAHDEYKSVPRSSSSESSSSSDYSISYDSSSLSLADTADCNHQSLASSDAVPARHQETTKMVQRNIHENPLPRVVYEEVRRPLSTRSKTGDVGDARGFIEMQRSPRKVHVTDYPGEYRDRKSSESDSSESTTCKNLIVARRKSKHHNEPTSRTYPDEGHSSFSINSSFSDNTSAANKERENDHESWSSSDIEEPHTREKQRMVQVTADLELPLHGAKEMCQALRTGNTVPVVCLICFASLRCIDIAQYVVCPDCRCLTPLETNSSGGVGLGLLSSYSHI
jgi:hypothetical protein